MHPFDEIAQWKGRYGEDPQPLVQLLRQAARIKAGDAGTLARLHENVLFFRAYPHSPAVAREADRLLAGFSSKVAELEQGLDVFDQPEYSGCAGTQVSAVYSYETARLLAASDPGAIDIDWAWCEDPSRAAPVLVCIAPRLGEEWPVEAHVPVSEWVEAVKPKGQSCLEYVLRGISSLPCPERQRAQLYDSMGLLLTFRIGDSKAARTHARGPATRLFCHNARLISRKQVSLEAELAAPAMPVRRLPAREARELLALITATSAVRYRELYGFMHPDPQRVLLAEAGRGVQIALFGIQPEWRLPLRAYHCGMLFKNSIPLGYMEILSFFERAEIGFNLYYTFREGETAWIYARTLRLLKQLMGVTVYWLDPYQIGHQNEEAIESGAFWFYRKLGFTVFGGVPLYIRVPG